MVQSANSGADRRLRVGVVGVGVMGCNHARVLSEMPGVQLVGVADPDRSQAEFVGRALELRDRFRTSASCSISASTPSRSRPRPICIATSRSPASIAACM